MRDPADSGAARDWRLFLAWIALAILIVAVDQISKLAILAHFSPGERLPLASFFNLVLVYNPGSAFSFLADAGGWQKWFFVVLTLLISLWIVRMLWWQTQQTPQTPLARLQSLALALILGGALGNLIDRLVHGAVVDFLDFHLAQRHWPAFNAADSAITLGTALFILAAWREGRGGKD